MMQPRRPPVDTVGAFVGEPQILAVGADAGPLADRTLGVKDLFDIAGTVTGAGNPRWADWRDPATTTASAVTALVEAGATVVGKTITDELAYSLEGRNIHHGTPRNVAAPGRIPGGSSAGSAAAVAAGLVDLGLGTDTGGSIRVPASYCGIWGWRPTHGAVPIDGVVPLARSFDTVGLLAADPALLVAGAEVLLGRADEPAARHLVAPRELMAEVDEGLAVLIRAASGDPEAIDLGIDMDAALDAFRTLQGFEAWREHGEWITRMEPVFGPAVGQRFAVASRVTEAEAAAARPVRDHVAAAVRAATSGGRVLAQPAAAGVAPTIEGHPRDQDAIRFHTLRLTCIAGLAGAPVVVAPLVREGGLPVGVAFVGEPGSDLPLLRWVTTTFGPPPT